MRQIALLYLATLLVFGGGIAWVLTHPPSDMAAPAAAAGAHGGYLDALAQHARLPISMLLIQIAVILAVSRAFIGLFRRLGQPAVVVEVLAGIALGPSLLGWLLPEFSAFIFPKPSFGSLQVLSQVGLVLFMFTIGMHLDTGAARQRAKAAILVSHASMIFPFFLGVASATWLYEPFAPAGVRFVAFALFMGIALSVTAFPVLARILQEHRLTATPLGSLALTCAAVDDISAWCLLAVVIAVAKSGPLSVAAWTLAATVVYVAVMALAARPLLRRLLAGRPADDVGGTAIALVYVLISALVAEIIGIHALFGAFFAGVMMPKDAALRQRLAERVEHVSQIILLPLFFALTGLRTEIGLLNSPGLWATCLAIIAVAVFGKLVGGMLAARGSGIAWGESFQLGVLLNTRGLMELVVLNIGYDLGILSKEIFAMLVIMAIVTTLMTGPLLTIFKRSRPEPAAAPVAA